MVVLEDGKSYYDITGITYYTTRERKVKILELTARDVSLCKLKYVGIDNPMALITAERYKELWEAEAELKTIKEILR